MEHIITTISQIENFKRNDRIKYYCEVCGKEVSCRAGVYIDSKIPKKDLLCKKCRLVKNVEDSGISYQDFKNQRIQKGFATQLDRYGGIGAQNKENLEKGRKTKKERYGDENYHNLEKFHETVAKRTQEDIDSITEKRKETCRQKYGKEFVMQVDNVKQKLAENNIKKFGFPNPFQNLNIREKQKQTMKERYGYEYAFQIPEVKNKVKKAIQEKIQDGKYKTFSKKTMSIRGLKFDSTWEMIFYYAMKTKGVQIKKSSKRIPYFVGNDMHYYFPDFEIGDELWEVKGDMFFDTDGRLINPFDKNNPRDEKYYQKQLCMERNNVRIVKGKDIKILKNYLDSVFLEKYLQGENYIITDRNPILDYYQFIDFFFRAGFYYVEELGKVYWRDEKLCIEKW